MLGASALKASRRGADLTGGFDLDAEVVHHGGLVGRAFDEHQLQRVEHGTCPDHPLACFDIR